MILDQLQQTLAEPHCASAWHALYRHWLATPDAASRAEVLASLAATALDDPRAGMLKFSFLRDTQDGAAFGALAARSALAVQPDNPDRLAAFAAFTWGLAITGQSSGQQLIERLQAAGVPELVERLTGHASAVLASRLPSQLAPPLVPRFPQVVNKVAIMAQYLGNRLHTPSMAVLRQCEVLVAEGKTVEIFSCQEAQPPDMTRFFGSTCEVVLTPFEPGFWADAMPPGVRLHCSDTRFSLATRWRDTLATLAAFDPDAVLVCGLFSPLASALHAVRPSVALNVHAFEPIVRADLWLSSAEPADAGLPSPWGVQAGSPRPCFHPFRIRRPDELPAVPRAALGIGAEAVVWITLGGRLPDEIDDPWASRMVDSLADNPDVVWLLVGGEGRLPRALSACPPERIKVFGTQTGIGAWLKLADIFVNPPRAGGGYSVAEAMSVGLPVVSLHDGDGGDKLGEHAVATLEDYTERLVALSRSAALRAEHGQALQQRFSQRLDLARSGSSLVAALAQACALAQGRLLAPASAA